MRSRFLLVACASLSALTLIYCGKPITKGSNLTITDTDAKTLLELRLQKTKEVRKQLDSIRDALKPLDNVLSDIGRALNVKTELRLEGKADEKLRAFLQRLQEILRDATKDMVKFLPDGSWEIERQITFSNKAEEQTATEVIENSTYQIRMTGRRVESHDELLIALKDLASGSVETIARGTAESKKIDFAFYPQALERFINNQVFPDGRAASMDLSKVRGASGACLVKIRTNRPDSNGEQAIHCKEVELEVGSYLVVLNPLNLSHNKEGITALVNATVEDETRSAVAEIRIEASPGEKTKVEAKILKNNTQDNK